jgi:hypothetical protein
MPKRTSIQNFGFYNGICLKGKTEDMKTSASILVGSITDSSLSGSKWICIFTSTGLADFYHCQNTTLFVWRVLIIPHSLHVSTHQRGHHQASINESKNVLYIDNWYANGIGILLAYQLFMYKTFLDPFMLARWWSHWWVETCSLGGIINIHQTKRVVFWRW